MNIEKRRGFFRLKNAEFQAGLQNGTTIFRDFVPSGVDFRDTQNDKDDKWTFVGYSPHFDEIEEYRPAPEYRVDYDGDGSIRFVKV